MPQEVVAPQLLIKQPEERLKYSIDFTNQIDTGVTISSIDVGSETVGEAESDLTIDQTSISGKKALMRIAGGTNAKSYNVYCLATLSNGEIIKGVGMLRVVET